MANKNRKFHAANGNNNMELTIDTGLKTYTVKNTQGKKIGELVFNPTDTDIIKRYDEVISKLDQYESLIKENNGPESVVMVSDRIKQDITYIINGDSDIAFFSVQSPLTMINGKFYFENVLETISAVIKREFNIEMQKTKKRIKQYTGSYVPGRM